VSAVTARPTPAPLRVADDRDPAVARFHQDFPAWRVWTKDGVWCAMHTSARDGLVGVTAGSVPELRVRLSEAIKAAS
jgi:hypothetical protein